MEIIPAIDIIGGKCVRLIKGDYKLKKIYSPNPLRIAQIFQKAGFKNLHLIDLDGAREGKIKNWQIIKKIAENTNLEIEFGGGVRDEKDIKKLLGLGINKVILGSLIFKNPPEFKKIIKKFGEKVIIAIDAKGGKLYYGGWQQIAKKELSFFLGRLIQLKVKNIICTDIERDGTLQGPNFSFYRRLIKRFPRLDITVAGGIRNIKDLKVFWKIGVAGAIIGKAIYEKTLSLDELKIFFKKKKPMSTKKFSKIYPVKSCSRQFNRVNPVKYCLKQFNRVNWKKSKGLIPVITQDFKTNRVLMLGFMNKFALKKTLKEGRVTYWSRTRKKLWAKGETSGNFQLVKGVWLDCDNDTLLIKVKQIGNVCHTGNKTCFFRKI